MSLDRSTVKEFADYLNGSDEGELASLSLIGTATVDGSGNISVLLDGCDTATPVSSILKTTDDDAAVQSGDRVLVLIQNRSASIIGNYSNPLGTAEGAKNNYFWFDPTDGAHISMAEKSVANVNNVLVDNSGMKVRNGTIDLASFSANAATIGQSNQNRFVMGANKLEAYNSSNQKYFEVSSNGMKYGNIAVASQSYADSAASTAESNAESYADDIGDAAEQVATRYISMDNNGIKVAKYVGSSPTAYITITGDTLDFYTKPYPSYPYDPVKYTTLTSSGMKMKPGDYGDGQFPLYTNDFIRLCTSGIVPAQIFVIDGSIGEISQNGTYDDAPSAEIWLDTDGRITFGVYTGDSTYTVDGVLPDSDDYLYLGTSGYRYRVVYATLGVKTSSDSRLKKEVADLDDRHVLFFDKLDPVEFSLKGEDSGKRYLGFLAQDVESALSDAGLDADKYDIVEDGSESSDDNITGAFYTLNYSEFIPILTKKIKQLEERIIELEAKVDV